MAKFKKEAKEYFIEDTNIQTHPIKLDVEGQEPKENIIFYKRFLRFKERHKAERVALFFLLVSIIVIAIVVIVWAIIYSQQDIHNDSIRPVAEIHYKANANQHSLISTVQSSTFFTPINK
ncbi:hypothetical protein [Mesomycoplasma hyorhinis]|uniref:hypothetical protein n=1 Tax=Mesomycoplasma hyorhinis TaxID=2100 RepID=UPI001C047030|nr:hypothetical protein [Mesomycoplasma hyorhinis]